MSNLFTEIEQALAKIPDGWTSERKAQIMASAILALQPAVTIEIGCWAGRGLISLALAHKWAGKGIVYGIDPYSAEASVEGQVNPADKEWWGKVDHEKFYKMAMENIQTFGVQDFCKLLRLKSDDVNIMQFAEIGIVSLDGNHGQQAIRDIERYAPFIISGGFLFVDDVEWAGGSVAGAIGKAKSLGFRELYGVKNEKDNWMVLQRV